MSETTHDNSDISYAIRTAILNHGHQYGMPQSTQATETQGVMMVDYADGRKAIIRIDIVNDAEPEKNLPREFWSAVDSGLSTDDAFAIACQVSPAIANDSRR
jgi:hypothetical protein